MNDGDMQRSEDGRGVDRQMTAEEGGQGKGVQSMKSQPSYTINASHWDGGRVILRGKVESSSGKWMKIALGLLILMNIGLIVTVLLIVGEMRTGQSTTDESGLHKDAMVSGNDVVLRKLTINRNTTTNENQTAQGNTTGPKQSALQNVTVKGRLATALLWTVLPNVTDMNVGSNLQSCDDKAVKKSFPDIDYSLLGYNILRGFPLASGHDPGFTYPIFVADYSRHVYTADCRYSVPDGFVVIPDVSCMTSFSSTTIKSSQDISKKMAMSATVHGGGWGVHFSASAGYKEASSQISTGESVYIISTAQCQYYFSKLMLNQPPQFHKTFIDWIYKLNSSTEMNREIIFTGFIEEYGTHFAKEVTYGARYTLQHTMSASTYQQKVSHGVNVEVEASYSGFVSVGGGVSLDDSQKKAASSFQQNVTTKTFTVGAAPPANGDATAWASNVKDTPVPTKYELSMITDLFTDQYMGNLDVDLHSIRKTLLESISSYCLFIQQKGDVDSCAQYSAGISFQNINLFHSWYKIVHGVESNEACTDSCIEDKHCVATTYVKRSSYVLCTMHSERDVYPYFYSNPGSNLTNTIIPAKIKQKMLFTETVIEGIDRTTDTVGGTRVSLSECQHMCIADEFCIAFSHCKCKDRVKNCYLYGKSSIQNLKSDTVFVTVFIGSNLKTTTSSITTSTTTSTTGATVTSAESSTSQEVTTGGSTT